MVVYLARHASAVGSGPSLGELDRYLSRDGREQARGGAACLDRVAARPGAVLTSHLVRAVQTAELLISRLPFDGEVRVSSALAPGADPHRLVEALAEAGTDLLAVGHAPDMGRRAAVLLGVSSFPFFETGMVVSLEPAVPGSGRGAFRWAYLPRTGEVVETLADLQGRR